MKTSHGTVSPPWPGFFNARSLAGVQTRTGPVLPGRLYRSDEPTGPVAEVQAVLLNDDVRTVLDLRSEQETCRRPSIFSEARELDYVIAPLIDPRMDHLRNPALEKHMLDVYRGSVARNGRTIAAAANAIVNARAGGVLIHCLVGKDRTGILTAVLLDALGAPQDQIVADYTVSEGNLAERSAAELATVTDPAVLAWYTERQSSRAETMVGLLDELHREYGGGAAYLRQHGVTERQLQQLAHRLTGV